MRKHSQAIITDSQGKVLSALFQEKLRYTEIRERTGFSHPTLSETLKNLLRHALIEKEPLQIGHHYFITQNGQKLCQTLKELELVK